MANQGLDLYERRGRGRWVAGTLALLLLTAVLGYRWMSTSHPVTAQQAVERFRAEAAADKNEQHPRTKSPVGRKASERHSKVAAGADADKQRSESRAKAPAPTGSDEVVAASGSEQQPQGSRRPASRSAQPSGVTVPQRSPDEGVYSWDTEGYEKAGGVRRELPKESQRIITHSGPHSWTEHHYFSEEREFWTDFSSTDRGAEISRQRNKVRFGPVTNDKTMRFSPPMLVGPRVLEVGTEWKGEWSGDTYGDYEGKVFERRTFEIDGESVDTFGIEMNIHLKGEQRGDVIAKVWIAPRYAMTVHEEWVQDVETSVGSYYAEWTMTVRSTEPQQ